jgi:bifunctional DNase/RNase
VLPIWIGRPEAESIVMRIHNIKHARPLTHDLCRNLIDGLGARLRRVQITHVANSTFFAELHLDMQGSTQVIDARPSDSIAVALRMDAPIFAADDLLTDPDADAEAGESFDSPERPSGEGTRLTADELKAYLEKLRPEDFGDFKP